MKKMARATLCFMVMLAILLPTLTRTSAAGEPQPARYDDNLECASNDVACKATAFQNAWDEVPGACYEVKLMTSDYFVYLSNLFNVQLRWDKNAYSVIKSFYPTLIKKIEQEVIRDTGVALPLSFGSSDKAVPPGVTVLLAVLAICIATANVSLVMARVYNDDYQNRINTITNDLIARGWPPDLARTEANYQWEHFIKQTSAINPALRTANHIRKAAILASKDYYSAWAEKNHGLIEHMIQMNVRERRFSPNPLGSGGMTGGLCRHAVYIPRSDTQNGVNNTHNGGVNLTGTVTVTTAGGYWACL